MTADSMTHELPEEPVAKDLLAEVIAAVQEAGVVSPSVEHGAPITWIPGVKDPWVTVTDDLIAVSVIAHSWPVLPVLQQLSDVLGLLGAPRRVTVHCVDVDVDLARNDQC